MASQSFQRIVPSPLCLSLQKFSYATVSNESIAPVPWIHLSSRNSLFAVFETTPNQMSDGHVEERQKLKVVRDPEIMEELDLDAFSAEARRSMAQTPEAVNANIPNVAIVVKIPMIAMKYPMSNGQIRRFQLRFTSNEDYYEAMKMLSRANIPTSDACSFPPPRPETFPKPSNLLTPNDSASQTGQPCGIAAPYTTGRSGHSYVTNAMMPGPPQPISAVQSADLKQDRSPYFKPAELSVAMNHMRNGPTSRSLRGKEPRSTVSLSTATTLVPGKNQALPLGALARLPLADGALTEDGLPQTSRSRDQQDITLGLPPRRELPFSSVRPRAEQSTVQADEGGKVLGLRSCGPLVTNPVASVDSEESTTMEDKRKRGPGQGNAKGSATKKPRVTTTRKAPATKSTKPAVTVPNVEDLSQRDYETFTRRTTRASSLLRARMAQQESEQPRNEKEQAEGSRGEGLEDRGTTKPFIGGPTGRQMETASKILTCHPHQEATTRLATSREAFPCTPADQMIVPPTPDSPVADSNKVNALASAMTLHETSQLQSVASFTCADLASYGNPAPDVVQSRQDAYEEEAGPRRSDDGDGLQAWLACPQSERDTALRSRLCQLIMDPGFLELCKTVEGMWERNILNTRLNESMGARGP